MSDERPDEFSGWKSRLEQAEGVPAYEPAEKDAVWEKLYDRLHGSRRRSRFLQRSRQAIYWMAAACLLVVLTTVYFRAGKENIVAGGEISSGKMLTNARHFRTPSESPNASAKAGLSGQGGNRAVDHHPVGWKVSRKVGWKPDTRSLQPMVQTVPSGDLSTAASREITHEFISDLPHPPPVYAQITPNDKPGKETATVPTTLNTGKKEWRVVHINELDHPAAAGQSMTNNREYRALHIHWSNEENQPDPSPVSFSSTSSSPDNTILQIRLSPANH